MTVTEAVLTKIQVTPVTKTFPVGTTQQYEALGIFSDDSSQNLTSEVTWQSFDSAVATISNVDHGLAQAVAVGGTTISASLSGITGTSSLTVSTAVVTQLQVTPATISLPEGTSETFAATAFYSDNTHKDVTMDTTWTSSDPELVAVDANGLDTGLFEGTATHNGKIQRPLRNSILSRCNIKPLHA